MSRSRMVLRLFAVATGLVLAGCAPSFGPGLQFGVGPGGGLSLNLSTCSFTGSGILLPMARASQTIGGIQQRVQTVQAEYSPASSDVRAQTASWKQAATGGC